MNTLGVLMDEVQGFKELEHEALDLKLCGNLLDQLVSFTTWFGL